MLFTCWDCGGVGGSGVWLWWLTWVVRLVFVMVRVLFDCVCCLIVTVGLVRLLGCYEAVGLWVECVFIVWWLFWFRAYGFGFYG